MERSSKGRAVLFCFALVGCAAAAPVAAQEKPQHWTDALGAPEAILPSEGYFIPPTTFRSGVAAPVEKVLAAGRKMTAEELRQYTTGEGGLKVSADFPLFVFKNPGASLFLWTGKHDGQQQIIPRVWNGEIWKPKAYGPDRADAVAHLFEQAEGSDACHVLVYQQSGQVNREMIHTDRVQLRKFHGVEAAVKRALEAADTVVYVQGPATQSKQPLIDCLKGHITGPAFQEVPGVSEVHYDSLVFLSGTGAERRIRYSYNCEFGTFFNGTDELRVLEGRKPGTTLRPLRWVLSRQAVAAEKGTGATLTWTNPQAARTDWLFLELAVGVDGPGALFRPPITRSGRDGGDPLFSFKIRQGDQEHTLTPRGRFGTDSFAAAEPESHPGLNIDYRFIGCGKGVIKLAIRPKASPWKAEAQATCWIVINAFEKAKDSATTKAVVLEVNP